MYDGLGCLSCPVYIIPLEVTVPFSPFVSDHHTRPIRKFMLLLTLEFLGLEYITYCKMQRVVHLKYGNQRSIKDQTEPRLRSWQHCLANRDEYVTKCKYITPLFHLRGLKLQDSFSPYLLPRMSASFPSMPRLSSGSPPALSPSPCY